MKKTNAFINDKLAAAKQGLTNELKALKAASTNAQTATNTNETSRQKDTQEIPTTTLAQLPTHASETSDRNNDEVPLTSNNVKVEAGEEIEKVLEDKTTEKIKEKVELDKALDRKVTAKLKVVKSETKATTTPSSDAKVEKLTLVEKYGFSKTHADEEIVPMYNKVIPMGTYFGFYPKSNLEIDIEPGAHKKNQEIVRNGIIGAEGNKIRYIASQQDRFKVGRKRSNYRFFSEIVEEVQVDGKRKVLLRFSVLHDHKTQYKAYEEEQAANNNSNDGKKNQKDSQKKIKGRKKR